MPCSNVQSLIPGGEVVLELVDVVVDGIADGSASAGVKIHALSKIRRSSIAISPSCDAPTQNDRKR